MNNHAQLDHVAPAFVDFDYLTPTMEARILDYLATHAQVTFVDLEDDVPGFSGDLSLRSSSDRNTILWRGVSSSAVHAISEMERQGQIAFKEASLRLYQEKGRTLQLPVAKWGARVLHWTPVVVKKTEI